jgi:protein-tyrosine phosphatase
MAPGCIERMPIFGENDHEFCMECKDKVTCHPTKVCAACYAPFHMITERIALGNMDTSYEKFDIIVNLNYPYNKTKLYEVALTKENEKIIIRAGLEDISPVHSSTDSVIYTESQRWKYVQDVFDQINYFLSIHVHPDSRILFHCYAGISRSSTSLILYLSKTHHKTTKSMYQLVKQRRPYIKPNSGFLKILNM